MTTVLLNFGHRFPRRVRLLRSEFALQTGCAAPTKTARSIGARAVGRNRAAAHGEEQMNQSTLVSDTVFRVEETKTSAPLELPITRKLATIVERRFAESGASSDDDDDWVFSVRRARRRGPHRGPIARLQAHRRRGRGAVLVPRLAQLLHQRRRARPAAAHALTKRLVNHAPASDITEGYGADWTIEQLREPAQRIADRIETLMNF